METAAHATTKLARKYLRNTWIHRLPITSWVYKKIIRLAVPLEERSINFRGKTLWVNTKDTSMVPSIISGDYEDFELDVYSKVLKPGITVLDIGANIGIYSLLASDKSSKVYSFEPVPENLSLLKKNVASNKAESKVHITEAAVGDKNGSIDIHIVPGSLGTHGVFAKSTEELKVKLVAIDDFVKRKGLKVGLIKMDIEGYEPGTEAYCIYYFGLYIGFVYFQYAHLLIDRS